MKNLSIRKSNLQELVECLKNQSLMKRDFVLPNTILTMEKGQLVIKNENENLENLLKELKIESSKGNSNLVLNVMEQAHLQISTRLNIPKSYYDKCLKNSLELFDHNVNNWLAADGYNYLLRCFINESETEGYCRAVLSNRYNIIDNYDVLLATLESVKKSGINLKIEQCDLTDRKMYIQFNCPEIEIESERLLKNYKSPNGGNSGHGIITGFVIGNSEVGSGYFYVVPRAKILACSNGLTFTKDAFSKVHLGAKLESQKSFSWSEKTKQKNYELILSQTTDAINTFCSKDYLNGKINEIISLNQQKIESPINVIRNVSKVHAFDKYKEEKLLEYFFKQEDNTAFGVTQSMTYYAHADASNGDEQYEMEELAIDVLRNLRKYDVEYKEKYSRKN
jgi:hypothetical protein